MVKNQGRAEDQDSHANGLLHNFIIDDRIRVYI